MICQNSTKFEKINSSSRARVRDSLYSDAFRIKAPEVSQDPGVRMERGEDGIVSTALARKLLQPDAARKDQKLTTAFGLTQTHTLTPTHFQTKTRWQSLEKMQRLDDGPHLISVQDLCHERVTIRLVRHHERRNVGRDLRANNFLNTSRNIAEVFPNDKTMKY